MILCKNNGHTFFVKYSQISDIIGEEEWVDGEMNTLSNIESHQIVNLSFGAKKEEKKNPESFRRSFYSQQEGKEEGNRLF